MRAHRLWVAGAAVAILQLQLQPVLQASAKVAVERRADGSGLEFKAVPPPADNDAATLAEFTLVDGERDPNSGLLDVLHDGRLPAEEDEPGANFFFRTASDGGRLRIDLGRVVAVKQINSYSRHPDTRAPQVYTVYGAGGAGNDFNAVSARGVDPATCGWELVASVDTRLEPGSSGGQHGVSISHAAGTALGQFRYLLFDISRTEDRDAFGNTFFSEIDVVDANGPAPTTSTAGAATPIRKAFEAQEGKYRFTIDATAVPDLMEWAEAELKPVVQAWYPRLVEMLPGEGFVAATNLTLRFRNDMGGTPASASDGRINMNSDWFRRELKREARGSVVHEMVHIVQDYGRARRANRNATRTPGWLVEGVADYIRWFLYEPETRGAEITERNLARARHDASYRVTGNFLDWVTRRYEPQLVVRINIAAREGRYTEELWKEWTGKTLQDLGTEWKQEHQARLGQSGGG